MCFISLGLDFDSGQKKSQSNVNIFFDDVQSNIMGIALLCTWVKSSLPYLVFPSVFFSSL